MSVAQQQALLLGSICLSSALVLAVVLALTRTNRFGVFATVNLFVASALFGTQVVFGFSGWRSEIIAAAVSELPVVFFICWVCLAQAGGISSRPGSLPSEPALKWPWMLRTLAQAPVVLLGIWSLATLLGLLWPSPAMQAYASAPVQFLLFKWPISVTQMAYTILAAVVFAMAAMSTTSATILRVRNGVFSLSLSSLALIAAESALLAGVRFWAQDQRRERFVSLLLGFEAVVTVVCFSTLAIGLALRYTPSIAAAVVREAYTAWLPARERLEALGWHAITGGRTRGITRIIYRIEETAELINLAQSDKEKAIATLQLMAVMQDSSSETGRVTPQAARELYELEREILDDKVLASKIGDALGHRPDVSELTHSFAVPAQEVLKAALELSDNEHMDTNERPLWFHLVSVASVDAGLTDADRVQECFGSQTQYAEAWRAYRTARDRLRSRTFGKA